MPTCCVLPRLRILILLFILVPLFACGTFDVHLEMPGQARRTDTVTVEVVVTTEPTITADQGTDAEEREKAFLLASREGRYVYHLNEALRRLDDGSYGKCAVCGSQIQKERLKAVPHATKCITCKSKEEKGE